MYNFHPEELEAFNPTDLYPPAKSDLDAASSSRAHLWPTFEDYKNWIVSEPDTKRRKTYQELAVENPALLVDIYHAASTAPPDSPPVKPDSFPMDIWFSLGYDDGANTSQQRNKDEEEEPPIGDYKGKGIMKYE